MSPVDVLIFVQTGDVGEIRVIGCGAPFGFFFRHDEIDQAASLEFFITWARQTLGNMQFQMSATARDRVGISGTFTCVAVITSPPAAFLTSLIASP